MLFLCWRFDGHGWSPKSQKMWKNHWNGTWDKGKILKTLRFFPFFLFGSRCSTSIWLVMSSSLDLSLFGLRPARRPHQWTRIPSSVPWGPQGVSTALGVDWVSPANGRGFYRLPETRRGQAVNVGFGSIMIEQDLMEARHGKEQWKGTNFMTGQEMKF